MADNRWFVRSLLTIGLVLVGLPVVANAQTTVSGQVKTSVGGTPLVGVIVSAPTVKVSATTDNGGNYSLTLPAGTTGTVTLTAKLIGYQTGTVQVAVSGAAVQQDIVLVEGAIELQGVVVTALGIEREKRSLTYAAQSISGDRLTDVPTKRRSGAAGERRRRPGDELGEPVRFGADRRPRYELDPRAEPAVDRRRRYSNRQLGGVQHRLRRRIARRL
jgi:hypothetical protein